MSSFRTDRRYYLNSEGKAVEEGDTDAQSLLFGVDAEVTAADAKQYGLKPPQAVQAEPVEAEPDAESKSRSAPPANKAAAKASDK